MKKIRKAIIILMCAVMLAGSLSISGQAAVITDPVPIQPQYINIAQITISFNISNSGLTTSFSSAVIDSSTHTCTLKLSLQRYGDYGWETIKTWSDSGKYSVSILEDWYVVSGYTYRATANAKVYDASGALVENAYVFSREIYY